MPLVFICLLVGLVFLLSDLFHVIFGVKLHWYAIRLILFMTIILNSVEEIIGNKWNIIQNKKPRKRFVRLSWKKESSQYVAKNMRLPRRILMTANCRENCHLAEFTQEHTHAIRKELYF